MNLKPISNAETINVLLTVLQLALPSITNAERIQEIQTMLSTAKILNLFSNDQTIQRPGSISLPLNPQQLYHHSTSFTPSPTNPSGGLSLPTQLRSLQSKKKKKKISFCMCCRGHINIVHSRGCHVENMHR
jgi:hypothetical protein